MVEINNFCRSQEPQIGFIAMDGFGLCASVFVDFGNEFTVHDKDGEAPKTAIIEGITQVRVRILIDSALTYQENPGAVHLHQDRICPFSSNDYVTFKEVQGMIDLNNCDPIQIQVTGKYSFTIGDTTGFSPYLRDGIVEQVKVASKLQFRSLECCVAQPLPGGEDCLLVPDLGKFGRSEQLHFAVQSVYCYRVSINRARRFK